MRKRLIEAYKAGLRRALMLTEGHRNVVGVKDLIDDMVMAGGSVLPSVFRRAVMAFLSEFSEHVGEKYGLKTYSEFLSELDYRENLADKFDRTDLHEEFRIEQGLYNALNVLDEFFWGFVRSLTPKNQSPQDGDEDAFLFTTIRYARILKKEHERVINDIIARKDEMSDTLSEEDINTLISILKMEKQAVAKMDFSTDLLSKRQKTRKK